MSNKCAATCLFALILCAFSCSTAQVSNTAVPAETAPKPEPVARIRNNGRVIHVLVALCDNVNQGIAPVPASLGNGEDPKRNLYWGAGFGVKTFFSKSKDWKLIGDIDDPKPNVIERVIFKHSTQNVYLIADAYRGSRMRETIDDFFSSVSGERLENLKVGSETIQIMGSADLVVFVGHNGLMDFKLETLPVKHDDEKRYAIILACASWNYFSKYLKPTGANPILWTSNLMAPEAFTLHDAIEGWIKNETPQQIRVRGAAAYAKYQKISEKAAMGLLVTGW